MKRIDYIVLALAAALSLSSCMNKEPIDAVHPGNYFCNASALQSWMNYCYEEFDGQDAMLLDADDFVGKEPSELLAGGRTPSAQSWDWSVLAQANALLDNEKYCKDEDAVARYDAEARFFRALAFFDKVRMFGDVPYNTGTVGSNDEQLYAGRRSRYYVMTRVLDEFQDAADNLTDQVFDTPIRINKWVALGFLARAALFEGTFLKYSGEEDWQEFLTLAADACEKIMDSGKFKVYTAAGWSTANAYRNLFAMETMSAQEALLVRCFNTRDCISVLDRIYGDGRLGATSRFVNHYQLINGKSIATRPGWETETVDQLCQGRDARLAQTLLMPGARDLDTDVPIVNELNSMTGYQPIKFRKSADASSLGACYPLLRYPEILLIYVEAKAELGTIKQADIDKTLNVIRARVGMPAVTMGDVNLYPDELLSSYYPNVSGKNKGIILEIRRERTIELALEGQRQWDMLRWHEGAQLGNWKQKITGMYFTGAGLFDLNGDGQPDVELYTDTPQQHLVKAFKIGTDVILSEGGKGHIVAHSGIKLPEEPWDEDRDYLWPVPAYEFSVSGNNMKQNYGY